MIFLAYLALAHSGSYEMEAPEQLASRALEEVRWTNEENECLKHTWKDMPEECLKLFALMGRSQNAVGIKRTKMGYSGNV